MLAERSGHVHAVDFMENLIKEVSRPLSRWPFHARPRRVCSPLRLYQPPWATPAMGSRSKHRFRPRTFLPPAAAHAPHHQSSVRPRVPQNERLNGHMKNTSYQQADVTEMEIAQDSYDFVFSNWRAAQFCPVLCRALCGVASPAPARGATLEA